MNPQTEALRTCRARRDPYNALAMPVYHTVAYEFDDFDTMAAAFTGRSDDPDYSRVGNPTVTELERKVAAITGARSVTAFNSGMAAISAVLLSVASAGKNIITSHHLFGNTYSLITSTLARFGVEARVRDLTDPAQVREAIDDDTCCIFLEAVTNPQLEVADIVALAAEAHVRGVPLILDTTIIPFTRFSAADLGVDIEVVSSTKYVSGGATSLGGLVIFHSGDKRIAERLHSEMLFNMGGYMTPHAAYMHLLGLETLDARYRVQEANAIGLARCLRAAHPGVKVGYPGLPDHPHHQLASRQFKGSYGAMLTLELPSPDWCPRFINALRLVHRATNLFDNKTLAIHPASTIYGNFTATERAAMDVSESLIRISVGLESGDDLFADISQAINAASHGGI